MPTLTVDQLTRLADHLSKASTELFNLRGRLTLTKAQQVQIRDEERRLDGLVAVLAATSIHLIADGATFSLVPLEAAIVHAGQTLETIKSVKKAIGIATALVNLTGALLAGQVPAVLKGIEGLQKATATPQRGAVAVA